MKALTIAKRDFKSYFSGPWFYVVACMYTIFLSFTYYAVLQNFAESTMRQMMRTQGQGGGLNLHNDVIVHHVSNVNLVLLIFVPFLTVSLFSEEYRSRSFDLLLTSPVSATDIAIGKFLAGFGAALVLVLI